MRGRLVKACAAIGYVLGVGMCLSPQPVSAQAAAKVSAIVQTVEQQPAAETARWKPAKVGSALEGGDKVRTGKRSKTELRFADASVVRLGELSNLVVRPGKDLEMGKGKMWGNFTKPGKIKSGSTVATVKGSEFLITILANGTMIVELISGELDIETPFGTVSLKPGQRTTISPGLPPSEPTQGTPPQFEDGNPIPDIGGEAIVTGTTLYTLPGTTGYLAVRNTRIEVDQAAGAPDLDDASQIMTGGTAAPAVPKHPPIVFVAPPPPPPLVPMSQTVAVGRSPSRPEETICSATLAQESAEGAAGRKGTPNYYAPHFGGDVFAYVFEGGSTTSARLEERGIYSGVYWEMAVTPTALHDEEGKADLTDSFLLFRGDSYGDITVGRQRFLKGPVQNTVVGTLIRQPYMDALTWHPKMKDKRWDVDLAFLEDSQPLINPGEQRGWYARGSRITPYGVFGLNVMNDNASPKTGVTFEWSSNIIRRELDFYGEYGPDNFGNMVRTVGVYFPGLYQRYDVDLFIEHAVRYPFGLENQTLLRAYRNFGTQFSGLVTIERTGAQWDFGIGLAMNLTKKRQ